MPSEGAEQALASSGRELTAGCAPRWRRRPAGAAGAPRARRPPRAGWAAESAAQTSSPPPPPSLPPATAPCTCGRHDRRSLSYECIGEHGSQAGSSASSPPPPQSLPSAAAPCTCRAQDHFVIPQHLESHLALQCTTATHRTATLYLSETQRPPDSGMLFRHNALSPDTQHM